ncbi:MAG: DUF2461 domain-containing protein [Phycisphaerales bacterium]|nr:DUF2461 domain-containing protein [Phycisphaerales bacterium]
MMSTRFPGFPRQMPTFFKSLEKNNQREWFTPRKEIFETHVRGPMIELVTLLNERLRDFAPEHVAEEPAKLIYRIYRDTRFSKDKTPYKTNISALFSYQTLSRHGGAGYYFEVSHRHVGIAGGVYMPGAEELQTIREAIAADPKKFLGLVEDRKNRKLLGSLQGERLTRLPKAWLSQASNPAAEYLKFKQFYWYVELPASLALTSRLPNVLTRYFKAMSEGLAWFNDALLAARRREEEQSRPKRPKPMW